MNSRILFETEEQRVIVNDDGSLVSIIDNSQTIISPHNIESITVFDDEDVAIMRHSGGKKEPCFANSPRDADEIGRAIAQHLNLLYYKREKQTVVEAGILPFSYFSMALLATVLLSFVASSEGENTSGRAKLRAIEGIADSLGTTGIYIIGGALTCGTFAYLCYKLAVRQSKTVFLPQ